MHLHNPSMTKVQYQLLVEDQWMDVELKTLRRGDVFRTEGNPPWRANSDAEYWEDDGHWGILATPECTHPNAIKEEHLTGEGAMEYVEWYDNSCPDCGKKWTSND